jgi:anti-sigma28 factor (negative regulator of flagellin synthesis)
MDIKTDQIFPAAITGVERTTNTPANTSAPAAPVPLEPAAKIRLSEAVSGAQLSGVVNDVRDDAFDQELVRQIQDRLDQGNLAINFDAVARNLLQDALAMADKPKSGVTL